VDDVRRALAGYRPHTEQERLDVARIEALLALGEEAFSRSAPLHVTGSALPVHPPTGRVALHWHRKVGRWLQLGGHADAGERDPAAIALREAEEESCLSLCHFPDPESPLLLHVEVVRVPAWGDEPEHEHADFRYVVATDDPDVVPNPAHPEALRWVTAAEALAYPLDDGLRRFVDRVAALLA
jgi:hypothetical protein